jgi:hypothetical protein
MAKSPDGEQLFSKKLKMSDDITNYVNQIKEIDDVMLTLEPYCDERVSMQALRDELSGLVKVRSIFL